jgi:hypothetical protein
MMKFAGIAGVAAAGLMLSGCATVFDGTTQKIYVNSSPPGARCDFFRKGETIANVPSTPGFVKIQKTKDDIDITCKKDGFTDAAYHNHSGVAGATFGDIAGGILTGGIAWAVDSGTGADNKYDGSVNVTLMPVAMSAPSGPAPASAPAPAATSTPVATTTPATTPPPATAPAAPSTTPGT